MLKLRFSEPFHKQYMDGRISLCKYDCTVFDNETKGIIAEFSVTGTAKCSPSDEVNPSFGAHLAESRAKLNGYKAAANIVPREPVETIIEKFKNQLKLLEFINQMGYLKKKELFHIAEISKE